LQHIHSDVWGHAIESFGRKKYYVSFIDGYSKFTWIYLLRHKSEVFKYFLEFQALVERMFNHKIIYVQSAWVGNTHILIPFFIKLVLLTKSHVLTPISKMALPNASTTI
jgi:hypothetical protein